MKVTTVHLTSYKPIMDVSKRTARSLWGRLTGSAKKAEEMRKAQEQAEAAQRHAAEIRQKLEAQYKAEQEAIERRKKEVEELQRQLEIKKAEETARKAEIQRAAEAAKKADHANFCFKYGAENRVGELLNPQTAISNSVRKLEGESWEAYRARLDKATEDFDFYAFVSKVEKTTPEEAFKPVFEELEKCYQNGGSATVDDTIKILEGARTTMSHGVSYVKQNSSYAAYDLKSQYKEYNKYLDEVINELQTNKSSGENPVTIVKTSVNNVAKRKNAAIAERNALLAKISQSYESQLAPIRQRLHYDESAVPVSRIANLNPEEKQQLADELNKIIASGGTNPNFDADTPLWKLHSAWRAKYISMPFSMKNQKGETAMLDMFPRYKAEFNSGEFKYEPLYRQMHIENPEEFIKQFENIGGEYVPGRLQSCSKEKLYGEYWGGLNTHYGFTEWNPDNNVKFVIHPKGPVSNAAEIGEGKYGNLEAIYAADSKFRILGTVKKTVTPEEIKKGMPEFKNEFNDFEKYEIHLQEM